MAMGDVEIDYGKLCSELELQEQEVFGTCRLLLSPTAKTGVV